MKIAKKIEKNKELLQTMLHQNPDIIAHDIAIFKSTKATILMIDGMTNKTDLSRFVIRPLLATQEGKISSLHYLMEQILGNMETSLVSTLSECVKTILDGDAILLVDGFCEAIKLGAKGYSVRAISEPPTSAVIKGPREGFTEDLKQNSILIRRRLKNPDLCLKLLKIGKYSQTNIFVCHIDGICDKAILAKVIEKLEKIDIDGILDSSYIANFLEERRYSIFKQIGTCEKPDILAAKLLEGRIGIIVDGSPIVLTLPFVLLEDYQSSEDYYNRPYRATMSRLLRLISVIICVLLPSAYVAAQIFHLQLIPLRFLTKVMASIQEIPLSPSLEMFFVVVLFEILKESSVRMPKYVGMALSVVGALVLGDTAVNSGIISTPCIMIVSISSIAMYTVPDQENALAILRLVFLALSSALGIIGILLGTLFLSTYLITLANYGVPYLTPFAPTISSDLKDGFSKKSLLDMSLRPFSIPHENNKRIKKEVL